jgi:hypothetical protein
MSRSQELRDIVQQLVGAWALVSWSEIKPGAAIDYPLGEDAIGQIIYSADGHVAAQLVRRTRERFGAEDWRAASAAEAARAWKEYFGYFGVYSIDLEQRAVVHHVEGAWFPNLSNTDQLRRFRFEDGQLVLDAETEWGRVRIVWERTSRAPNFTAPT